MCVAVTLDPGAFLSFEEVYKMDRSNADGVGVAWANDGIVSWYKSTSANLEYVTRMIWHWRAVPRLVHFRVATVGGMRPDLCHPFEVGPLASCAPVGKSSRVMVHNGHWSRWRDVHDILEKEDLLPDKGPWSDTRLAALMMNQDMDWIYALGGRVAVMNGDGEIYRHGDWAALRDGIHVSNKGWEMENSYKKGGYTGFRGWKGWKWEDKDWEAYANEQAEMAKAAMEEKNPAMATVLDIADEMEKRMALSSKNGNGNNGKEGQSATGNQKEKETSGSGGSGRIVSAKPYVDPRSGDIYQADPNGNVVKVTQGGAPEHVEPKLGATDRTRPGRIIDRRYSDGEVEDLTHLNPDEPYGV